MLPQTQEVQSSSVFLHLPLNLLSYKAPRSSSQQILDVPALRSGAQTKFSGHKNSPWNYRVPQRRCGRLTCPSHVVWAEAGGIKISFGENVISPGRQATCPSQRRS